MASPRYFFKIVDSELNTLAVVLNARARKYAEALNKKTEASFRIQKDDETFSRIPDMYDAAGKYGLIIEKDGVKVWGGEIVEVSPAGADDTEVEVIAESWDSLLSYRITPGKLRFDQTEAGGIVENLLDRTQKGNALLLNGTTQYAKCAAPTGILPTNNKFSIGCWVKLGARPGSGDGEFPQTLVAKGSSSAVSFRLERVLNVSDGNPGDKFRITISANGSSVVSASTGAFRRDEDEDGPFLFMTGETFFVVASWDGNTRRLIINAFRASDGLPINPDQIDGSIDDGAAAPATIYSSSQPLWIGRLNSSGSRFYRGYIQDIFATDDFYPTEKTYDTDVTPEELFTEAVKITDLNTLFYYPFYSGAKTTTFDWSDNDTKNDLELVAGATYGLGIRGYKDEYDLGIRIGTNESTQLRDREYDEKNILEAITELTDVINGFDYEITPDKILNILAFRGTVRDNLVFEYREGRKNISSYEISNDTRELSNEAIAVGQSTAETGGDTEPPSKHAINWDSIYAHKIRQAVAASKNVTEEETLTEKAEEYKRIYGTRRKVVTFKPLPDVAPPIGAYDVGDLVPVVIEDGPVTLAQLVRVYERKVDLGEEDQETVDLTTAAV